MAVKYVSAFCKMMTNELSYNQYIATEHDKFGNPTRNGKLIRGMTVNSSSVYYNDPLCQPHMVFHNNPQSWMPDYVELREGKGCHIGVDLRTPYKTVDGSQIYKYNMPIVPEKMELEIDNTDSKIVDIELWGSVIVDDCDDEGDLLVDEDGYFLCDLEDFLLADADGYGILIDPDIEGRWLKIQSFNKENITGCYIKRIFDIESECLPDMMFNRFRLVFRVNPKNLDKYETIYLKKWDILKRCNSCGPCRDHLHTTDDIIDYKDCKCLNDKYVLPPVRTFAHLPYYGDFLVGTMCTVIDEMKIYVWDGTIWKSQTFSGSGGEVIDKYEDRVVRSMYITQDSYKFNLGVNFDSNIRVEDEDGIKWTENEDYTFMNNILEFNRELIPGYKYYPNGLKINIYATTKIEEIKAHNIYLASYDDIIDDGRRFKAIFQLSSNEDNDLMLLHIGYDYEEKFSGQILFDGIDIIGPESIVYTLFVSSDGYLMSNEGDYDAAGGNEVVTKNYDYILINNVLGSEKFYLDINYEGYIYTVPYTGEMHGDNDIEMSRYKSTDGSMKLSIKALSALRQ